MKGIPETRQIASNIVTLGQSDMMAGVFRTWKAQNIKVIHLY